MKLLKVLGVPALAVCVLFTTGCSSMTNTGKGAAIGGGGGAALGAGLGALIGGGKGAAIGTAIGAAVGTGAGVLIGKKMDKQQAELQEELKKQAEVEKVTQSLGGGGRILLRQSGTEPVVRVMVEAGTQEICEKYVDQVIDVMKAQGHLL